MKTSVLRTSLVIFLMASAGSLFADTKNGVTYIDQAESARHSIESLPPIEPELWNSGEIADHIFANDDFDYATPSLPRAGSSELQFKYGMWNGTTCEITVTLNGTTLGTVVASQGYSSPGPQYMTWDTFGILSIGVNEINVTTDDTCSREAIVGAFVIYGVTSVPENVPALSPLGLSLLILLLAWVGLAISRRTALIRSA